MSVRKLSAVVLPWALAASLLTGCSGSPGTDKVEENETLTELREELSNATESIAALSSQLEILAAEVEALSGEVSSLTQEVDAPSDVEQSDEKRVIEEVCRRGIPPGAQFKLIESDYKALLYDDGSFEWARPLEYCDP